MNGEWEMFARAQCHRGHDEQSRHRGYLWHNDVPRLRNKMRRAHFQTRHAQSIVEAAIAEARSVRDEVSSRIAEVAKRLDVSMSNVADALTGKVPQVAVHFEAQTSQAIGQVAQQLEREVKAVAMSTALT